MLRKHYTGDERDRRRENGGKRGSHLEIELEKETERQRERERAAEIQYLSQYKFTCSSYRHGARIQNTIHAN